jgi:hypothetical protein
MLLEMLLDCLHSPNSKLIPKRNIPASSSKVYSTVSVFSHRSSPMSQTPNQPTNVEPTRHTPFFFSPPNLRAAPSILMLPTSPTPPAPSPAVRDRSRRICSPACLRGEGRAGRGPRRELHWRRPGGLPCFGAERRLAHAP